MNYGIILTLPDLSMVDVHLRKMIHTLVRIKPDSIDRKNKTVKVKWYEIEHNPLVDRGKGRTYYKKPKTVQEYRIVHVGAMNVERPPEKIERVYKAKKGLFATNIIDKAYQQAIAKKVVKPPTITKRDRILELHKSGVKAIEIARTIGAGYNYVNQIIRESS